MDQRLSRRRLYRLLPVGVCLAGIIALLGAGSVTAQQGQYVTQAAKRLSELIDRGNGAGYKLTTNKFSMGGGWLAQSKDWTSLFTLTLEAGKQYRLLAAGDNDAMDVDLQLLDPAMNVVARDVKFDPTAEVDYTPAKTLKYTMQVRVFKSRMGAKGQVPSFTIATVMSK
jgi:hypothetical protein